MIIQTTSSGHLFLITQPDHAAAAAEITDAWQADGLPRSPRRTSILRAVREHDAGWAQPDSVPLVDGTSGRLLDFVHAPVDVRQGVWPRSVSLLSADPWAAALVATHAITVYDRFRGHSEWAPFFKHMAAQRDEHLAQTPGTADQLLDDYAFLRLADLGSLAFCNPWLDVQRFGPYQMQFTPADATLTIRPDPFASGHVVIDVVARRLPGTRFTSSTIADAWAHAPHERISVIVRGA